MIRYISTTVLLAVIGITLLLSPLQATRSGSIFYEDQVAVLMYHHIHDQDTSSSTITGKLFREQLQFLRDKGYHFITLNEFRQYMQGSSVPANSVLVTFDDGYQSFYNSAYPTLRELLIPAVNFIITGDMENPTAGNIPYMTQENIAKMTHETNFIDAQCHTNALHNKLPTGKAALVGRIEQSGITENEEQYQQRIKEDTLSCRQKLAQLYEQPIDSYAYPFGITNKLAASLVKDAGIKYAFTIIPEMATRDADPMRIPRINAGSPGITPEVLHHTIQRRVVAQGKDASGRIEVNQAIRQLGGDISQKDRELLISLHGKHYTVKLNSQEAAIGSERLKLKEPVTTRNGTAQISLEDLQALLKLNLVYNPMTNQITERITPTIRSAS